MEFFDRYFDKTIDYPDIAAFEPLQPNIMYSNIGVRILDDILQNSNCLHAWFLTTLLDRLYLSKYLTPDGLSYDQMIRQDSKKIIDKAKRGNTKLSIDNMPHNFMFISEYDKRFFIGYLSKDHLESFGGLFYNIYTFDNAKEIAEEYIQTLVKKDYVDLIIQVDNQVFNT